MLPRVLLVLTLAAPLAVSAQYATIGPNGQVAPAGSTVIVVGNGTGPVLNTPSVSFGTQAGTAGISLADKAGISNLSPTATTVPAGPESYPVYSSSPYTGGQPATGEAAAPSATVTTGRLVNAVGPSYYGGAAFAGGGAAGAAPENTGSASLGDVAAQYKSNRPQNIRTYTNADAQRLSDTVNLRGTLNPTSAQNTQPTMPQTQTAQPQANAPQLSASARPSPMVRDEAAQSGASAQSSSAAGTDEQGATTPQASQPSSSTEGNDQQTDNHLPATSTLLPLFGLLGIASGALGVWLKRHRG